MAHTNALCAAFIVWSLLLFRASSRGLGSEGRPQDVISDTTAVASVEAQRPAGTAQHHVAPGHVERGSGRRLQQGWVPSSDCISGQSCNSNGKCLASRTWTSTSGCGGAKEEKRTSTKTSNGCRWTGCNWDNCRSDEWEAESKWCWISFSEKCCKLATIYTCRDYLACSIRQPDPKQCASIDGYSVTAGMDHFGDDIGRAYSSSEAWNRCLVDPNCKGWADYSGTWYLKNTVSPVNMINNQICLYAKARTDCPLIGGYTVYTDTDHVGDDIASVGTRAAALERCNADIKCQSFNSWGYYKTAAAPRVYRHNVCLYVKTSVLKSGPAVFGSGGIWDATATSDRTSNAYIAGIMAAYAYKDGVVASGYSWQESLYYKILQPLGATALRAVEQSTGAAYIIMSTPDTIFVSFRGTEVYLTDLRDLGIDLASIALVPSSDFGGSGVMIGFGWYSLFKLHVQEFMDQLTAFKAANGGSSKRLWFTGHSLGATLTTLFAAYAHQHGHPVQGVYTFGSTIVGNDAFRRAYPLHSVTYRYENDGDLVPQWPSAVAPAWYSYSYQVGTYRGVRPCTATVNLGFRRLLSETNTTTTAAPGSSADGGNTIAADPLPPGTLHQSLVPTNASVKPDGASPTNSTNVPSPAPAPESPLGVLEGLDTGDTVPAAGPPLSKNETAANNSSTSTSPTQSAGVSSRSTPLGAHSMMKGYLANLWYCVITNAATRSTLPPHDNVWGWNGYA